MTPTVLCVLRSGGAYSPVYVERLARGVARHSPPGTRFVCLSDVPVPGVETRPLRNPAVGWWAKMEAWAYAEPGLVLYIDLDSVVVGDLSPFLSYPGKLAMTRDFNLVEHPQVPGLPAIGSAVVIWRERAMRPVYDRFMADPEGAMAANRKRMDHFIRRHLPPCDYVQDLWPGRVVCAKQPWRNWRKGAPPGASIITTWGAPRMHDLPSGHWYRQLWEAA